MSGSAPEPATEKWTFGGVRVGQGGKRLFAWLDADGEELLFSRPEPGWPSAASTPSTSPGTARPSRCTAPPPMPARPPARPSAAPCGPGTPSRGPAWR